EPLAFIPPNHHHAVGCVGLSGGHGWVCSSHSHLLNQGVERLASREPLHCRVLSVSGAEWRSYWLRSLAFFSRCLGALADRFFHPRSCDSSKACPRGL